MRRQSVKLSAVQEPSSVSEEGYWEAALYQSLPYLPCPLQGHLPSHPVLDSPPTTKPLSSLGSHALWLCVPSWCSTLAALNCRVCFWSPFTSLLLIHALFCLQASRQQLPVLKTHNSAVFSLLTKSKLCNIAITKFQNVYIIQKGPLPWCHLHHLPFKHRQASWAYRFTQPDKTTRHIDLRLSVFLIAHAVACFIILSLFVLKNILPYGYTALYLFTHYLMSIGVSLFFGCYGSHYCDHSLSFMQGDVFNFLRYHWDMPRTDQVSTN